MAACRRGSQTNLVALALYISECQFRTVSIQQPPVKPALIPHRQTLTPITKNPTPTIHRQEPHPTTHHPPPRPQDPKTLSTIPAYAAVPCSPQPIYPSVHHRPILHLRFTTTLFIAAPPPSPP
jgi:hypothetical protein